MESEDEPPLEISAQLKETILITLSVRIAVLSVRLL